MVIMAPDSLKHIPRFRFMHWGIRLLALRKLIAYLFSTYEFHIEFAFDLDCDPES